MPFWKGDLHMIERHGTHVCKNPDCNGEIAWSVFLKKDRLKEGQPIVISSRCLFCGTKQKWIQEIKAI